MFNIKLIKDPSRYLIYPRKSRQDDPNETVEEVLAKHVTELQEYAERELGGRIPEENIYREVVSGGGFESIAARTEFQKVLKRIESSEIIGVLAVDVQRLGRPELNDAYTIISSFRFSNTLVITPRMVYDLENDILRKYFQDELLRGKEYLDYTKVTLKAGRDRASKRGCHITGVAPFGYDRVQIGKDWTLEPNDMADVVRMMFDWYVNEGLSVWDVANRLEDMGVKPKKSKHWNQSSVERILTNPTYAGKIRYNYRKKTPIMVDGKIVIKEKRPSDPEEIIFVEGKHPALISQDLFDAAQNRVVQKSRKKKNHDLNNVLAGLLRCKGCGKTMRLTKSGKKAPDGGSYSYYYSCPTQKKPGREGKGKKCYKSAKVVDVVDAVLHTLEQVELPKLHAKIENGDGNAAVIQKRRIDALTKQLAEYHAQEENQYELLETKQYTQELFNRRNAILREKMEACEKELFQARQAMPKNVDYGEKIVELEEAIKALRDPDMSNEDKNRMLKTIIERIDYSATNEGYGKTMVNLEVFLRL